MPKLHHQNKSISPVKARAKIKLERNHCPEILAVLVNPKTIVIMPNLDSKDDYPLNQTLLR